MFVIRYSAFGLFILLSSCSFISKEELQFRQGGTAGCDLQLYVDQDGDGFGSGPKVENCSDKTGLVENDSDCNDADPNVNPNVVENCATPEDDNCDGSANEIDGENCTTWYADSDDDSFGANDDLLCACSPYNEYSSATSGDCDDTDPNTNPDQTEVCGDGKDNNCDGLANGCGLPSLLSSNDASYYVDGETAGDNAGVAVSTGGQVLDKTPSFMVNAPYYGDGDVGRSYIVGVDNNNLVPDYTTVTGAVAGGILGFAAVQPADLNQDNFDDLVIAAPFAATADGDGVGAVYLLNGPLYDDVFVDDSDALLLGQNANDRFGWTITHGDFSADGTSYLAIGAYGVDSGYANNGAVYLFATPLPEFSTVNDATFTIYGGGAQSYVGYAMAAGQDYSGDGIFDLVTGGYKIANETGSVYQLNGPITTDGNFNDASVRWDGANPDSRFGIVLSSAGDLDGNGVPEIAATSSINNQVYILDGQQQGTFTSDDCDLIFVNIAGNGSALQVSSLADSNGDQQSDFAIGAPSGNIVYIFYGPLGNGVIDVNDADVIIEGSTSEQLGSSISFADLNVDGLQDILIGARTNSTTANRAGRAYVFIGEGL